MATATSRKIFVNLAVEDLGRSVAFFTELGFSFDPRATDENATCMIVSDEAFVMLLVKDRFRDFTTKELCDPATHTEVLMAITAGSREEVDATVERALAAGGKPSNEPQDHGFMYGSSFQDPDGHIWEVLWMNSDAVES